MVKNNFVKRNEDYAGYDIRKKIENTKEIEKNATADSSAKYQIMHSFFYVEGEHPFGKLNLIRYGYNKIHSTNEEIQVVASVKDKKVFSDENYKKDLIFESKRDRGMIIINLDCKNNYHEIEIIARKGPNENMDITKRARSMLERELNYPGIKNLERGLEKLGSN